MQNAKQTNGGLKHTLEAAIEEFRLPEVPTHADMFRFGPVAGLLLSQLRLRASDRVCLKGRFALKARLQPSSSSIGALINPDRFVFESEEDMKYSELN